MNVLVAAAVPLLSIACSSLDSNVKMESHSVAKRLGVSKCRVSVPLTRSEVLNAAHRLGDPITESRPEWAKIGTEFKPGDQLRMVDCVRSKHNFYFAHIHDGSIVTKMYTMTLD